MLFAKFLGFRQCQLVPADVAPDSKGTRRSLIAVVGAVERPASHTDVPTAMRTLANDRLHQDIAVIRPCVDVFDPKTVRASMGSIFQLRLHVYDDFSQYQAQFPEHTLYPFMLDGSKSLPDVLGDIPDRWTLIFGNEGSGLPPEFSRLGQPVRIPSSNKVDSLNLSIAAAIGIYAFARR